MHYLVFNGLVIILYRTVRLILNVTVVFFRMCSKAKKNCKKLLEIEFTRNRIFVFVQCDIVCRFCKWS